MKKHNLIITPILLLVLTGCGSGAAIKNAQQNGTSNQQTSKNDKPTHNQATTDPLADANLKPSNGESEGDWLHLQANKIVTTIEKSNSNAKTLYAHGFSDGSDEGQYVWNGKYHQQSNRASNALTNANGTNGVINAQLMHNKYYRLGWILSNAQGAISADNGNFHGAQSELRYTSSIKKYQAGKAYSKQHHEKKYVAYDDGINKWFTHKAASLADTNFS